ncbi:hypothetical protein PFICI_03824 [Pestalotiopsis fici W106-1]|uniref:Heterokaryon incompatibility domain-containing protein n=1 Tax=Pestalotiopsis fici (strain W106-1 / CGMCC3.15140) TaxID=1229662 RepID=W3XIH7_PESFW|nr:uncharacterized protein PFICI_03824 [Pestalotiopsis fici W106-1]ETS85799.1 hypothetical protein PFICI_03824 [Pestalotiopsis fici W106-1]
MDDYQYDPLPGGNYIRTATILPGEADDGLVIDLAIVPFADSEPVNYEALSYAWGSPEPCVDAEIRQINDSIPALGHTGRRIRLSKNLAIALYDLRRNDNPRTMWIDAVCINQMSHEEKAVQVSKIGDIFKRAAHVVAYIGPETDGSTEMMEYLEFIGKNVVIDWDIRRVNTEAIRRHKWRGMRLVDDNGDLLIDIPLQDKTYQLFTRPWFKRLWIRQEIVLSRNKATIMCGRCGVSSQDFLCAWTSLYLHFSQTNSLQPQYLPDLWRASWWLDENRDPSLRNLRDSFAGLQCLDPRDRLFAVLELLPKAEKRLIGVDYEKQPEELYKDATLAWIQAYRDLSILQECELQNRWFPTWVPNWGTDSQLMPMMIMTSKTSQLAAVLDISQATRGALRVAGTKITTIKDLRPSEIYSDTTNLMSKLHDLLDGLQLEGDYIAGGTLIEAYATTIARGKFETTTKPESFECSSLDDMSRFIRLAYSAFPPQKDSSLEKGSVLDVRMFCVNRQLLKGSNGYVGMAPPAARVGDHVYSVVGCDCPLVLRNAGEGMQVVGQCFLTGAMEKQAILGPLPTQVEAIYVRDQAKGYQLGFRDRQTKEITMDDPRLSTLPLTEEERERLHNSSSDYGFEVSFDTLHKFNSEVKWLELV